MKKKVQLKKFLRFGGLCLATFLAGCASGGSIGPEFKVNRQGETEWGAPIEEVLRCESRKLIVCKTYGSQRYCRCSYPPRIY